MTSNSTEDYDRGEKLNHYKQCPSVNVVLFVSHRRPQVIVVSRTTNGWQAHEYRTGEAVEVRSLGLTFSVDELYAGIGLENS